MRRRACGLPLEAVSGSIEARGGKERGRGVPVNTVRWEDGKLTIIDQTLLPVEYKEVRLGCLAEVWDAIKTLKVRGAPAIGISAAFGVLVGLGEKRPADVAGVVQAVRESADYLAERLNSRMEARDDTDTFDPDSYEHFYSTPWYVEEFHRIAFGDAVKKTYIDAVDVGRQFG